MKRPLRNRLPFLAPLGACALLLALTTSAAGDVVTMKDGRRLEGTIEETETGALVIDTVVVNIRTKLRLDRNEIEKIERKPLPKGFFDLETKAAERESDPTAFPTDASLYLEIPIVGKFGSHVQPRGVARSLAYASAHSIPYVVFFVDSQGGDELAAAEIYRTLRRYDEKLNYVGIVRDSVGVAMAVTVWCDRLFILPGANLGGSLLELRRDQFDTDPDILREQIAFDVDSLAQDRGWPAGVVRAMIEPSTLIAAWQDPEAGVLFGARVPADVSRSQVIFRSEGNAVLTLDRKQAAVLGNVTLFQGDADGLGRVLEVSGWTRESDFGQKAMLDASQEHAERMRRVSDRHAIAVKKNIESRTEVQRSIDRYLEMASQWDPQRSEQGDTSYASADSRSRWIEFWGPTSGPEMNDEEKRRWRDLSDITAGALRRSLKGVKEMKKLDQTAMRLGLEPNYAEDDLAALEEDLKIKITLVEKNRNRKFR